MKKMIPVFLLGIHAALTAQGHLLLSEIALQPAEAEFIEIFNPSGSAVSLEGYYLADNQVYPYVPGASLPALDAGDFIVKFPSGAVIHPHETAVIAVNGADFEADFGSKADFEISDGDAATPDMVLLAGGNSPGLANAGEGVALFYWNGTGATVKDVDLMNAGVPTASSQIVDKSAIPGYVPDAHTIPVQGHNGPPGSWLSTKRILLEGQYETPSGGNGITGHDETSEDISVTWDDVFTSPTPGSTGLSADRVEALPDPVIPLKIHPNPFSAGCPLVLEKPSSKACVFSVYDLLGRRVLRKNSAGASRIMLETGLWGPGVYIVEITDSRNQWRGRIIASE
ncbi:MAG: lamin tail domain-containing protein [Fibrobacterota bacterium]